MVGIWGCHSNTNKMGQAVWFLALSLRFHHAVAQANGCPTTDLACHDIINSSQCIEQVVLEGSIGSASKEALIKCVEYEGTASNLPGATKVFHVWDWRM